MITSYPLGIAIPTPPTRRCSATTPVTPMALIRSTRAGGNVSSIPYSTPIFVIPSPYRKNFCAILYHHGQSCPNPSHTSSRCGIPLLPNKCASFTF